MRVLVGGMRRADGRRRPSLRATAWRSRLPSWRERWGTWSGIRGNCAAVSAYHPVCVRYVGCV